MDFQALQQQPRDQITEKVYKTPLSAMMTTIAVNVSTENCSKALGERIRQKPKEPNLLRFFLHNRKGVHHSPHQIPRPQNHGTRPDRGQRGKGSLHHMTMASFLFPRSLLATNSKRRQRNERQAKRCQKANLDGQPASQRKW